MTFGSDVMSSGGGDKEAVGSGSGDEDEGGDDVFLVSADVFPSVLGVNFMRMVCVHAYASGCSRIRTQISHWPRGWLTLALCFFMLV